jgi:hypothetical protein
MGGCGSKEIYILIIEIDRTTTNTTRKPLFTNRFLNQFVAEFSLRKLLAEKITTK